VRAADFDQALSDSLDALPVWALDALAETVVRVETRPPRVPRHEAGPSVVIYREPLLAYARSREELERLVRAELVRALVRHLDLDPARARQLASS
jgi:predicted Zn-dependent protease with MMP-like domain